MVDALNKSQMTENDKKIKEEVNTQLHKHLSTIFVVVGIISFSLGAIVNWYTIKRLNGQK